MLVNLTVDPKKRVKNEKQIRKFLHIPDCREATKNYMKKMMRGNFWMKYRPLGGEYTKDTFDKFTGVYLVYDVNFHETFINRLMKQHALEWRDCGGYENGDAFVSYGLCDNASQAVEYYNRRVAEGYLKGNHVILLSIMHRNAGWRWHKWGPYLGTFNHCHEYVSDEDESLKYVYAFDIVKVV